MGENEGTKLEFVSKEKLLELDAQNLELIPVSNIPTFPPNVAVYIKPFNQSERESLDEAIWANVKTDHTGSTQIRSLRGYKPRAVALSVCDAEGKKIFTEQEASQLSSRVINYLWDIIEEASGLKMGALDDAAKK
jgi:hypothetical protein